MTKIVLLCAAGMSTSALVRKMKDAAKAEGYECDISAHSVSEAKNYQSADMILLGPQVRYRLKEVQGELPNNKVEVIDMKDYGMMNGKAVVDSREVARMLGRPHKNLLADIHRYISAMERRKADGLNFQPVARDFQLVDFFVPSTYTNDHNQTFPCYLLTQKGCEMVANKLTGEKGILFTAAYVNAFHALQEQAQASLFVGSVRCV